MTYTFTNDVRFINMGLTKFNQPIFPESLNHGIFQIFKIFWDKWGNILLLLNVFLFQVCLPPLSKSFPTFPSAFHLLYTLP